MKNTVFDVLENMGIILDETEQEEDLDLTEYIVDSIQFISFIIELERVLNVVLPDNFLIFQNYHSLNALCGALKEVCP